MIRPKIDYPLLGQAVEFYRSRGWQYVEAPWAVPDSFVEATCPTPARTYMVEVNDVGETNDLTLVGSAEQSFLALDLKPGRYVACTPCFRVEPDNNLLYQPWFIKVELHDTLTSVRDDGHFHCIEAAKSFYAFMDVAGIHTAPTDIGEDLMIGDVEIGSFGVREHPDFGRWAYGTGLALPRFSVARGIRDLLR